jgi:hypothetical protein
MVSPTTATSVLNPNQEMIDFDYKKYSLENLENWLHDAMSSGEATPDEIYDLIMKVVRENYYHHKHHASQAYELLCKLNGNGQSYEDVIKEREYYEPSMPPWGHSDIEYLIANKKENKVVKWQLPVEVHGPSGEYFVMFPDDLLEAANLKEGDQVEWIDRNDGSFELRKVNGTK